MDIQRWQRRFPLGYLCLRLYSCVATLASPPIFLPGSLVSIRSRLIAGTGAAGFTMVIWSLLQILAVPIYLHYWTAEIYAAWLTLNAVAALLAALEFGITLHLEARMMAAADKVQMNALLSAGLALFVILLCGGMGLILLFWWLGGAAFLGVTAREAQPAALVLAVMALLQMPRPTLSNLFTALGRFPLSVYLGGLQQCLVVIVPLGVAANGGGLLAASLSCLTVTIVIGWLVPLLILRRLYPFMEFRPRWPGRSQAGRMLADSSKYFLFMMNAPVLTQVPVILLQRLGGGGLELLLFTTVRTYAGVLRQMTSQISTVFSIEMVKQHHHGSPSTLISLFASAARLAMGVGGLGAGFLLVAGGPVFQVWTHGKIVFDSGLGLAFLLTSVLVTPGFLSCTLMRLAGYANTLALLSAGSALLSILFCLALVPTGGALGAGIAMMVTEVAAVGIFAFLRARRLFQLPFSVLLTPCLVGLAGVLLGAGVAMLLFSVIASDSLLGLMLIGTSWASLILPAAVPLLLPTTQRRWLLTFLSLRWRRDN